MVLGEYIERVAAKAQLSASADKLTLRDHINHALEQIFYKYPEKLKKEDYIELVAGDTTGTISSVSSTTVTGSGTAFTSFSSESDVKIRIGEEDENYRYYDVDSISTDTSLTLTEAWQEDSISSGTNYMIYKDVYTLPSDFWKPVLLTCRTRRMIHLNEWKFSGEMPYPERTDPGDTIYYTINPEQTDTPTTYSGVVYAASSSASDTSQTVTVYGQDSNGRDISEDISLNGTTKVAGTTTWAKLYYIVLSTGCTGTITIYESDQSTTITSVEPQDLRVSLITETRKMRVYPVPDDNYPVLVKYYRTIPYMESDGDYCQLLDRTFDWFIIERAYIEHLFYDGDDAKAGAREARWIARLLEKKARDFQMDRNDMPESFSFADKVANPQFDPLNRWHE